jgi:hypothetical protein
LRQKVGLELCARPCLANRGECVVERHGAPQDEERSDERGRSRDASLAVHENHIGSRRRQQRSFDEVARRHDGFGERRTDSVLKVSAMVHEVGGEGDLALRGRDVGGVPVCR